MYMPDEYAEPTELGIVARYEMIRDYGRAMCHYAAAGDWDQLIALQTTYVRAMEALADAEAEAELSEADSGRKYTLILEIRGAEADIRGYLNRRLGELSQFMAETRQRQHAVRAYESEGRD